MEMSMKKIMLFLLFLILHSSLFANDKVPRCYLMGNLDGIEIRIKLLTKYNLCHFYDVFDTSDDFYNFIIDCSKNLDIYRYIARIGTNDFPVEIKNNSSRIIKTDAKSDYVKFLTPDMTILKNFAETYSTSISPHSESQSIIFSQYSEKEYNNGLYKTPQIGISEQRRIRDAYSLNSLFCLNDFDTYNFIRQFSASMDESKLIVLKNAHPILNLEHWAVYYLGEEKKEIYLDLVYE